jgi:hypothetical protein
MPTLDSISVFRRLVLIWPAIIRPLLIASAVVLLSACSAVKLAYNNLPDLTYWWIDGYADLGELQSVQLRNDLDRLHAWHRANELPRLADLLQQIQRDAPADTTAQDVCHFFDQVRERLDVVRTQAEAGAVTLAMSLTPAQIKHIESKFTKNNAEWRRDWASGDRAQRLEKRLESSVDRAEQFYGTLDDSQRAVLQAGLARSSWDPQRSYPERLRRQQDLLQTLRTISAADGSEKPSRQQATTLLQAYLNRTVQAPDPAYRAYAQTTIQENCVTYAQLHNSTSAEQRARAVARVAAYERDARELAGQL